MRYVSFLLCFVFTGLQLSAQKYRLEVQLKSNPQHKFPAVQSYVFAQSGNKVLVLGGRTDGLHRRQPFASFDPEGNNTLIRVLDLSTWKIHSRSVNELDAPLAEQLQSSNMQFAQSKQWLYVTGGYGYSKRVDAHVTFPYLTVIDVPELIQRISTGSGEIRSCFRQIRDDRVAVTGGRMKWLENQQLFLVGGQRFDGSYNPMGPNHGPGFEQVYTNAVRSFGVQFQGDSLVLTQYREWVDTSLFHRRDYNLLTYSDASGRNGLTICSGVFRTDADLPYTNLTDVYSDHYQLVPHFNQEFNHYHTASLSVFDTVSKSNYFLFFGGIARSYMKSGKKITDNDVPFVKHISLITRHSDGHTEEQLLPVSMPDFLGAAAEVIPAPDASYSAFEQLLLKPDGVWKRAGYLIGGINSKRANVFWDHEGDLSHASSVVLEVWIRIIPD